MGIPLQMRSFPGEIDVFDIIHEDDTVRISHGNTGDGIGLAIRFIGERLCDDRSFAIARDRDLIRQKMRSAHIDAYIPIFENLRIKDACPRFDGEALRFHQSQLIRPARKAADAIPAHLAFRSIIVEHTHTNICLVRRQEKDHAVRAYAEVSITDGDDLAVYIIEIFFKTIHKYIIIAAAMPFGKVHSGFILSI